ncbi:molybdenum cofactor guanylyltransferase [Paenibacillus sp. YN15]|uniref:molybdenum cofactor guanylyltransferase n=1 Tax=Paenibacillus sp. YN15 TaxID=1742774 RepID=UPI0015EC57DF|nr:molybdenum cofactor guanylyltransferase [Paenibacillus sp. YN15]
MLTGAILAGGQNRRMGKEKALLPFSGELLIQRQIRTMSEVCEEIIVVTNQPTLFLPILDRSIRIITDYYPGKGPLSGMHAALTLSRNPEVWIVGCDMPFLSAGAATAMQELKAALKCDAVVPVIEGRSHPLHGIYSKGCADAISALLLSGESRVSEMLRMIYWQEAPEAHFAEKHIGLDFVTNMNTPEEYELALKHAAEAALS